MNKFLSKFKNSSGLLEHLDPTASRGRRVFDLPLTRAGIADFLGLTIETVSRQLSKLRAERVVVISGIRHVEIPDLTTLKARCG